MSSIASAQLKQIAKRDATPRTMISILPLKLVYTAMLDEFPVYDIREFWDAQVETVAPKYSRVSDFYFSLWNGKDYIPFEDMCTILQNIEQFASKKGLDIQELVLCALKKAARLEHSAQALLCLCAPVIEHLFKPKDMREQLLKAAVFLSDRIATGMANFIISNTTQGDVNTTLFTLLLNDTSDKRKFSRSLPKTNCGLWAAMWVKNMPALLSLEPVEDFFMMADPRRVIDLVPSASIIDNFLFINGKRYGKVNSFHDFCKKRSVLMKIQSLGVPDDLVIEVEENYICPDTKKTILHEGCSYESPVAIYGFNYRRLDGKPKHTFSEFIKTATGSSCSSANRIEEKHSILMDSLHPVSRLVYHTNDDSVSLNGRHLIKSVPAQILKHLLQAYTNERRTVFEYKELLKNKEIVVDIANPNIAVRIQRLSSVLNKNFPQLKIIMLGRGKFRLQVDCKIHFSVD